MSTRAFVGLGANQGDAAANVERAADLLAQLPHTRLIAKSRLYRTPAWGETAQADFINAVAALDTDLAPRQLLDALLALEREFGRDRSAATRWGPRTLDLDVLLFGDARIDEPGLNVPHPHLHERAFALLPLLELAPHIGIPGVGLARDCLPNVAAEGIEALTYTAPSNGTGDRAG